MKNPLKGGSMTDDEIREYLRPVLKLNFEHEGNITTLVKAIRRLINKELK